MQIGRVVEVYKGFTIFEAEGDYARAGFKYQIDISPIFPKFHYGVHSIEFARTEIDFIVESTRLGSF